MVNAARLPTFYEFDSMDLLKLYREMDARDEEPVVVYHSHTATEAYPSRISTFPMPLNPMPTICWCPRASPKPTRSDRFASWTAR